MPLHTRYVPPEQTIVVKGLQRHEVLPVKGFVTRYTNALGVAVHADCADKETVRSLLYCNFRTPREAGNALDGVVQFMLQTFPKISEHHQVPGAVLFARCVCLLLCSVCARLSVQVARAASACRCSACAGVLVHVELRVLTDALRAPASRCTSSDCAHVQVARKSELVLNTPLFSVCVNNTPPWTAGRLYQYVSQVTGSPLSGVAVHDPKRESAGVRFVRFNTFQAAKRLLDLSDAGELRAEGFLMRAVASRNTAFVQSLAQAMDAQQCAEWTFDRLRAFTLALPTIKWPPIKSNIEPVLRAVPCEFALDDCEQKVYRVRVQVQAAVPASSSIARAKPASAAGAEARAARRTAKADAEASPASSDSAAPSLQKADATASLSPAAAVDTRAAKTRAARRTAKADAEASPASSDAAAPSLQKADATASLSPAAAVETRAAGACSPLYACQPRAFTPFPWLCLEEPMPTSVDDSLPAFVFSGLRMRSRFAFANVGLSLDASDNGCGGRWPGAPEAARTDAQPASPCLSASTDIQPGDSRSMCSQALTHSNPMRSWGVQQVAEFFESMGFGADTVRDGSVDGETLLQKFEEEDADFFTEPAPEGLGLTKLQYKGRLRTELQRWTNARCGARQARA